MTFTTNDLHAFLEVLAVRPDSRAQLHTLFATDELQTLTVQFERLTAIVEQLAAAEQRTQARLERFGIAVQALAEAQQRTEAHLEQLVEAQQRLEATMQSLAEAQQRTEARLERLETTVQSLAEAQQRTEAHLERLETTVQSLAEAQQRSEQRLERLENTMQKLVEEVRELVGWQRGESGRREGERYERLIQRRAPALFVNGDGGAPEQFAVQQRLTQLLRSLRAQEEYLTDEDDPFLADLIWWKGDHVIVVEASLQVDGNDVSHAARRAQTLQRAKAQATGVVIGEKWATPETRQKAMQQAVQWKVGDDLSEGFVGLRRLAPGE